MSASARVAKHRQRQSKRGLVRVEIRASQEDAELLRTLATLLADPERGSQVRRLVESTAASADGPVGLKDYLAASPLPDIDLTVERDPRDRDVVL